MSYPVGSFRHIDHFYKTKDKIYEGENAKLECASFCCDTRRWRCDGADIAILATTTIGGAAICGLPSVGIGTIPGGILGFFTGVVIVLVKKEFDGSKETRGKI